MNIVLHPNPILTTPSADLSVDLLHSDDIQQMIREMIPTMYAAQGIGLAAPQIGKNLRVCIIGKDADESLTDDLVLVNPTWERLSRKHSTDTEGCLSIPKVFGKVKRWKDIHVEALDRDGNPLSFDAHDFFARVIQHEVDHLDGVLFIDKAKGIHETE